MTLRPSLPAACAVAAVLAAGWIGLNAGKPVHVDDVFFLHWARLISAPEAGTPPPFINYIRYEEPMAAETHHYMPGWAILLAAAIRRWGERLPLLHWLQWPFATSFLIGVFMIARVFRAPAWTAMLVCAASPAFLVPASGLMPDIPAAGLSFLALGVWYAAPSWPARIAAALLLALGAQMKQSVLVLYPLLVLERDGRLSRQPREWLLAAGSLLLAGWYPDVPPHDPANRSVVGHVVWILRSAWHPALLLPKAGYLAASAGALLLTPFAYAFAIVGRRSPPPGAARWRLIGFCALGLPLLSVAGFWKARSAPPDYWQVPVTVPAVPGNPGTFWFYVAMVLCAAWVVLAARRRKDVPAAAPGPSRLLVIWVLLAGAGFLAGTFFPAVRHLIPLLPPLVILFLRDLRSSCRRPVARLGAAVAIAGNLWIGLSLASSDHAFASWCRDAAERGRREADRLRLPLFTTSSWGLRYYVERADGRMLERATDQLSGGAIFLQPELTDHRPLPEHLGRRAELPSTSSQPLRRSGTLLLPAVTIAPGWAAGAFYGGHVWFPYAMTRSSAERIRILVVPPLPDTR